MSHAFYSIWLNFAPLVALAEGEVGVNPPDWIGWVVALLSLVLPTAVYFWLKNRPVVPKGMPEDGE